MSDLSPASFGPVCVRHRHRHRRDGSYGVAAVTFHNKSVCCVQVPVAPLLLGIFHVLPSVCVCFVCERGLVFADTVVWGLQCPLPAGPLWPPSSPVVLLLLSSSLMEDKGAEMCIDTGFRGVVGGGCGGACSFWSSCRGAFYRCQQPSGRQGPEPPWSHTSTTMSLNYIKNFYEGCVSGRESPLAEVLHVCACGRWRGRSWGGRTQRRATCR